MFMKLFIRIILPFVIPIIFIILFSNINYNSRIKRILLIIFSLVYHFIFGTLMFSIKFVFLSFLGDFIKNTIVAYIMILLIYIILIVPINIFVLKKEKFNTIIYILINVVLVILGYCYFFNITKNTINLFPF